MPLMRPEIQKILRASGLDTSTGNDGEENSISNKLTRAGLGTDTLAEELTELARHSSNESLKLRALEMGFRVHGALKEQQTTQIPSFTIVIQSGSVPDSSKSTNILFPRQSLNATTEQPN